MAKYRVLGPVFSGACLYDVGSVIEHTGWPVGGQLEPLDDEARRVRDYYVKHHAKPYFPATPFNSFIGEIFLPELSGIDPSAVWVGAEVSIEPSEGAPRYQALHYIQFGRLIMSPGEEFSFLGWPGTNFHPINEAAHTVEEYYHRHRNDPDLSESVHELLGLRSDDDEQAPRYMATEDAYLKFPDGDTLIRAGTAFDYVGMPGRALHPLNAAAKAAKKNYSEFLAARPMPPFRPAVK